MKLCFDCLPCLCTTTTTSDGGISTTTTTCYCSCCYDHLDFDKIIYFMKKDLIKYLVFN